jgi:tripartite-type tricarboxylate transporter receptor subunit TctC
LADREGGGNQIGIVKLKIWSETVLMRRVFLVALNLSAITAVLAGPLAADDFPSRPVTMIVAYPAGGPTDAIGRVIAQGLQSALGHPVVVENIGGASGALGTEKVARATPDGYTIGLGNSATHVVNGATYALKYDVVKDFEPIGLLAIEPIVIVGRPTLPANNLRELLGWLKDNSGKSLAGTAGVGSVADVALYFLEKQLGVSIQHVPYRGLGPAVQALMSGEVDLVMSLPANVLGQVQAGTIKGFAVTAKTRLVGAPNIPTVDEAGLEGFYQSNWHALFAPKGTPKEIIRKLNAATVAALADPQLRERLVADGQDMFPPDELTPEALAAFQLREIAQRWPIIKAAGIKAE